MMIWNVFALLFCVGVAVIHCSFLPNVTYVSFLHPIYSAVLPFVIPTDAVYMANVSNTDDDPLQLLLLPWKFPYFGLNIETFWVSANGGFFKQASVNFPYCQDNFWATYNLPAGCDIDDSFYGMLAGFYSDLYPANFPESSITYIVRDNTSSVQVLYNQVPFYGPPVMPAIPVSNGNETNTFGIELFQTGQINLNYYNLFLSGVIGNDVPYFMSGMRQFEDTSRVVYTAQQVAAAQQWNTTVLGVYPPNVDSVQSGEVFTICPISTVWALSPYTINVHSVDSDRINISLHPLSTSCFMNTTDADSISFGLCVLASNSSEYESLFNYDGYFNATELSCLAADVIDQCYYLDSQGGTVSFTTSATDVYVHCIATVDQILNSLGLSSLPYSGIGTAALLQIAWRRGGGSGGTLAAFETLPIAPVPVVFINSSQPENGFNCSINVDTSTSSTIDPAIAACLLFDGNLSVFDLECSVNSSPVTSSAEAGSMLYTTNACNGACLPYDFGYDNHCCNVYTEMDCSGQCFGPAYMTVDQDFHNLSYCCSNIDACGVCNGNDFNGSTCIEVTTEFPDGNIYFYYDIAPFDNSDSRGGSHSGSISSSRPSDQHADVAVLMLKNTNTEQNNTLSITLQLPITFSAPFVEVTESTGNQTSLVATGGEGNVGLSASFDIAPGANVTLLVKSNINGLINDIISQQGAVTETSRHPWEVKQLSIFYTMRGATAHRPHRLVTLYPSSYNCSAAPRGALAESNMCSQLPGCIFCRHYKHMRILRGEVEGDVDPTETDTDNSTWGEVGAVEWKAKSQIFFGFWQQLRLKSQLQLRTPLLWNGENINSESSDGGAWQRRLYIPIMPPWTSEYVDHERGVCSDGWLPRECNYDAYRSSATASPAVGFGSLMSSTYITVFTLICTFCCFIC